MKIIGLCGGSGSGKGAVSKMFSNFNIPSIDADAVYHDLTDKPSECLSELVREFGEGILNERGTLDRSALGKIVFFGEDAEKKRKVLNEISHRHVLSQIRAKLKRIELTGAPCAIVDAPLLFESGFNLECDVLILVTADTETRIKRITERDNISEEAAKRRILAQLSDTELSDKVDYVIDNSGAFAKTYGQVTKITQDLLKG